MLGAAVAAGILGWQQIQDERDARKDGERHTAALERREQAVQISTWIVADDEKGMRVVLSNASNQPVYEAVVSRVAVQGSGAHTGRELGVALAATEQRTFAVIPPGEYVTSFGLGFHGMGREPGIVVFIGLTGRYLNRDTVIRIQVLHQAAVSSGTGATSRSGSSSGT